MAAASSDKKRRAGAAAATTLRADDVGALRRTRSTNDNAGPGRDGLLGKVQIRRKSFQEEFSRM